ncbi:chitin synthase-domain-containing protein, partial [Cladochytrium replicatum]
GNFVFEIPVAEHYLEQCPHDNASDRELISTRYTAVTCDPDDFGKPASGYTLRQKLLKRETELMIIMTMYNEDEELFCKTLMSVFRNIAFMCSKTCNKSWGPQGWQNVVVTIVSDGRAKVHPRVLAVLGLMGVWHDHVVKTSVPVISESGETAERNVAAHLFEFTTQVGVDPDMRVRTHRDGLVPVQILFCLKEKNAKKINSHRWAFNAFAPILDPNVCVLLDVGTKPTNTSIYHLWRAFDRNVHVGGACGEICAEKGPACLNLLNPLVASQNFEYKMSNVLDKPLESIFGYIQVLPGAFSAYRYEALKNTSLNSGPLAAYFHGEKLMGGDNQADVFSANMYLAEDRILCFELVTKKDEQWVLKYVKSAKAETDVPSSLPELISQRRRWLNGSFFAAVHSITHYLQFFRSGHGFLQHILFAFQNIYNIVNLLFSWFAIGNFYLTFHFLFLAVENVSYDPFGGFGSSLFRILRYLYIAALLVVFLMALGNRPQGSKFIYYSIVVLFSIIMGFLLFLGGYAVYKTVPKTAAEWQEFGTLWSQPAFRDIVISMGSTWIMYLVSSTLYLEPFHMATCLQYLFLLPTYINVFQIYSFCNLHDISWGTKGDNVAQTAAAAPSEKMTLKRGKGKEAEVGEKEDNVVAEVLLPDEDRDAKNVIYDKYVDTLRTKPEKVKQKRDVKTKVDDYFKLYRTRVILFWILCNGVLTVLLTTDPVLTIMTSRVDITSGRAVNPYLTVIFWSVAGISGIRFFGSCAYLVSWIGERSTDICVKGQRKRRLIIREKIMRRSQREEQNR